MSSVELSSGPSPPHLRPEEAINGAMDSK
jgi:hypothetical protein